MTILPLAYAVAAYLIGVGGLAYMILWMAGLAPGAFGSPLSASTVGAFVGDVCLLMLWSVQHSVMARARFKDGLTKIIPAAAERSTYVLMSGVVLFVMVAFWSPMPQVIWNAQHGLARVVLWGIIYRRLDLSTRCDFRHEPFRAIRSASGLPSLQGRCILVLAIYPHRYLRVDATPDPNWCFNRDLVRAYDASG